MTEGAGSGLPLPLLVWSSPAFPIGSFAFSHGLEAAAEAGQLRSAEDLAGWLGDLLAHGSLGADLAFAARAHDAAQDDDRAGLCAVNALALAMQGGAERFLETTTQGAAFLDAIASAWATAATRRHDAALGRPVALAVAVAVAAAGHGIARARLLDAHALGLVSAGVSAAVRLAVVGQSGGQRVIAALLPAISAAATRAAVTPLDDIGGASLSGDFAALAHETLYTRLFRS